jgi:signal transduction histidine kinase
MKNSFNRPTVTVNQLQLLVEQEKIALAREIHDELGGHLIATAMDLAALKQRFVDTDPDAVEKINRAARSLNAAVDMMRRVTEELHPTLLDNVGLFLLPCAGKSSICPTAQASFIQSTFRS